MDATSMQSIVGKSQLDKPKGKQLTYVFTSGQRLHVFDVVNQNLSGAWHRVYDSAGVEYIIDPAKILYVVSKIVA